MLLLAAWMVLSGCRIATQIASGWPGSTPTLALFEPTAIPERGKTPEPVGSTPPTVPVATESESPVGNRVPPAGNPEAALLPDEKDAARLPTPALYRLWLQIDESGDHFVGQAVVRITNHEEIFLDRLYFHLLPNGGKSYGDGSLNVTRITSSGGQITGSLSVNDSILELPLLAPLAPGEQIELGMEFEGQIPQEFGGGYGIYSYTNGILALSGWYPILAVYDNDGWNLDPVSDLGDSLYSDTAYYSVRVCNSPGWIAATTGKSIGNSSDNCTDYESGPTRDFVLVLGQEFQTAETVEQGVTVRSFYRPEHETAGKRALQIAVDSLRVFNKHFGTYPFNELDVVEAPMQDALGVEFPGLVLIADELYGEPDDSSFPMTIAHEVAHQWWYSVIGNDVFDEPWLDEGITTYSSVIYFEKVDGKATAQEYLDYWRQRWSDLRRQGGDDVITRDLAYFEGLDQPRVYSNIVYMKSALFYEALRNEIGDAAFFVALRSYYEVHRFGIATTQDLLAAFEAASSRSLDGLFETWLYSKQAK